jgi:hypothetical protein
MITGMITGMISGFRRKVAGNCSILGYYAASSSNFLPKFRYNLSVPSFLNLQDETGKLY